MSFRKLSYFWVFRNILNRNICSPVKTKSPKIGFKGNFKNIENLLSQDESEALWLKINQTLQIFH